MNLTAGKVSLVTGSSGIAAATAAALAAEGSAVYVVGIDADDVEKLVATVASSDTPVLGRVADLRFVDQTEAAFDACLAEFGRLDNVVAIAGGSGRRHGDGPIDEMSQDAWDATLEMNLTPVMTTARSAVRAMRPSGGSLVIVSSVLALYPAPERFGTHAYAAAKGAALTLVRSLAASYLDCSVRVNAVLPAVTDTPMAARVAGDDGILSYLERKQPLTGGMLDAADVANVISFLCSDGARAITGQTIAVDGGWSVASVDG